MWADEKGVFSLEIQNYSAPFQIHKATSTSYSGLNLTFDKMSGWGGWMPSGSAVTTRGFTLSEIELYGSNTYKAWTKLPALNNKVKVDVP